MFIQLFFNKFLHITNFGYAKLHDCKGEVSTVAKPGQQKPDTYIPKYTAHWPPPTPKTQGWRFSLTVW